jgi:hypothetical protein
MNRKHYEELGYVFTNYGDDLFVKTSDLTERSSVKIKVKCDNCNDIVNIEYSSYKNLIKDDKYFCKNCSRILYYKNKLLNGDTSFEQWCIENNKQDVLDRWDYELNDCKPNEIHYKTNKKCYLKCPNGIHKSELKNINTFTNGKQKTLDCNQCNMISVTHPHLVKFFININDAQKYSKGSHANIIMKCPECGFKKVTMVSNLVKQGFGCPKCKKNYYPERFFISFLEQLNIKFITQLSKTSYEWCDKFYYDFYIPNINAIIETHGLQHYKNGNGTWGDLEKTQNNDKEKELRARENDIHNYIIID